MKLPPTPPGFTPASPVLLTSASLVLLLFAGCATQRLPDRGIDGARLARGSAAASYAQDVDVAAPSESMSDSFREAMSLPVVSLPGVSLPVGPRFQEAIPSMDQEHPRTMATFSVGLGQQTNELNTGNLINQIATSSTSSQRLRLRGEHFFESGFGAFFEGYVGFADDIQNDLAAVDSSSQDTAGFFLAASYRATLNNDFRMPVRFGPFLHQTKTENNVSTFGELERSTWGVRLSAEPEYIVFQKNNGGKISELSVFGEIAAGAGPTNVQDNADKEDAYAFTLNYEIGVRYRFESGLLASLSYMASKYHVGTSESYNNAVFFGIDDDWNGVMLTAGWRF
ncbi:MAG: hypothetical protein AB8H80_14410 [Planctomycetota bacterium]